MKEQYEKIFLKKLQDCINDLNELDEIINTNPERQRKIDLELSDWYHFLQNKDLNRESLANVAERIATLRKERASMHKEYDIIKKFNELKDRLNSKENRQFMIVEIHKTLKEWETPYKNRILTENQIQEVVNQNTKIVLKDKRTKVSDEEIWILYKQGVSQKKIADKFNMAQPSISMRLKKIKEGLQ